MLEGGVYRYPFPSTSIAGKTSHDSLLLRKIILLLGTKMIMGYFKDYRLVNHESGHYPERGIPECAERILLNFKHITV